MLQGQHELTAANASAAILVLADGRYLVQLRDDIDGIWFPGHWGFFGGAVEHGESALRGLQRELIEELALELTELAPFTRMDFDLGCVGGSQVWREYFTAELGTLDPAKLTLGEGRQVQAVTADELLLSRRMVPYDAFALWMHATKVRTAVPTWFTHRDR